MWAEEFLKHAGIEHRISSPELESVVDSYIAQDINFFVFDLIEVSSEPRSIEPIKYRFDTGFLYYPLKISTLASGWTDISLFLLTPEKLESSWLLNQSELGGMEIARFYGGKETLAVQFEITQEELASIGEDVANLLEGDAWLTAMTYHGDLARFDGDLKIYRAGVNAELGFDYYPGRCTSHHGSQATIGTLGDMIVVNGEVVTPTPCYELEARLDIPRAFVYPPTIVVDIISQAEPGVCIECLGEVPFQAKIANLVPAQAYDVIVQYKGDVISQKIVYLPLSSPVRSDYAQIPDEATLETVGTPETGFALHVDDEVLASEMVVRIKVQGNDHRTHIAYLGLRKGGNRVVFEVNNVPAEIKLSQNCRLKIMERQIFLDDDYWLLPVRVMPDEAVGQIEGEVKSIEFQAVNGKAIYQMESVDRGKFLRLVSREINIETEVDALSGEIVKLKKPWWARFCW